MKYTLEINPPVLENEVKVVADDEICLVGSGCVPLGTMVALHDAKKGEEVLFRI